MKKDLSKRGKISLLLSLCTLVVGMLYMYFIMDGRTILTTQDSRFILIVVLISSIFLVITLVERARAQGTRFSWRRFGIILLIVILFGIWRVTM
ncbi:hypothetical protein FGG79_20755 [Bacillus sp. BHET2]|uniref:hypothetical protein n=1 Tax=Bacillus sp. BHET2 TaxID=2583818 RepID=UPI00110F0B8B|nr:hypothetical protein [Bacillus sp. BHET2]TMU82714.1 hypothetical protein FGG79_20755 [Bacillus sp. BHET2]